MYQLKYNFKLGKINEELIYYKEISEMPNNFLKYLENKINKLVLIEESTNTSYCTKCFNKLSNELNCNHCNIKYKTTDYETIYIPIIILNSTLNNYYYYFDVSDNNVLVYKIVYTINIYSDKSKTYDCHRSKDNIYYKKSINIDSIICIKPRKIIDFINDKSFSYKKYFEKPLQFDDNGYIYTSNLELLKDTTIFKYKPLWKCREFFINNCINFNDVLYYSLTNKCFEYLVNYKLYNLAFSYFTYKGSFKKSFGVGREYLDFIVSNNLNIKELQALSLLKMKDLDLIKSIAKTRYINPLMRINNDYKIDILYLLKYLKKNNLILDNIEEYTDYLDMLKSLDFDLSNKKYLFPKDFHTQYETIYKLFKSKRNYYIRQISNYLNVNTYEDDDFIIYPPNSLISIIDEANQQSNCLEMYIDDYIDGNSQIYFMREKSNIDKSLVTIEVNDCKVIQAFARFNRKPSKRIIKIINKWEKTLIPIDISTY